MEIYLIRIRKANGEVRVYVGQTKLTSAIRFQGHLRGDQLVDVKIRQHGTDNTELIVLEKGVKSFEELDRLEIHYIKEYESFIGWNKGGYNLTLGGAGTRTVEIEKDELQAAVDAGKNLTEMSIQFGGIDGGTIATWMKAYNIKIKNQFEIHETTIRLMVEAGNHVGEISIATGIASTELTRYFKSVGLKARRKTSCKPTECQIEQVKTLTEQGLSSNQIEHETGVHFTTVLNIQKRLGIRSTAKVGLKKGATAVTPDLISKVKKLRETGLTHYAIAREIRCSKTTVRRILIGEFDHLK